MQFPKLKITPAKTLMIGSRIQAEPECYSGLYYDHLENPALARPIRKILQSGKVYTAMHITCLLSEPVPNLKTLAQMHANLKALRAAEALCTPEFQWFADIRPDNLPKNYPTLLHKLIRTPGKVTFNPKQETRNN